MSNRIGKMELIERVIFKNGESSMSILRDNQDFIRKISDLDSRWFNFMPDRFFMDKWEEEFQEMIDATMALVKLDTKYDGFTPAEKTAVRYAFVGEMSDVILASSSALAEGKVSEEDVIGRLSKHMEWIAGVTETYGLKNSDLAISRQELAKAHSDKINELHYAMEVYNSIVFNEPHPFKALLLKLYTPEELVDPSNKMKIAKEIRRMSFAINWSKTNHLGR